MAHRPYLADTLVHTGKEYAYAPLNGLVERRVLVCGMSYDPKGRPARFIIRYVGSDGRLSDFVSEVVGWFKSIAALPESQASRYRDLWSRERKQLDLKIQEAVA